MLKNKENSLLWLLDTNNESKANLLSYAKAKGVNENRILFAPMIEHNEHIQRQMCADLFLDTFPISAHTSASDAVWVGLPLITMAGKSMVSRVAGSILKNINMEELITNNYEDYKNKALFLSKNPDYLEKIRSKILENRFTTSLFDTKTFTKNLENEYYKLFSNWRS